MSAGNDDLDLDMELAMAENGSMGGRGELINAFPIQTTEIEGQSATPTLVDGPGFGSGIALTPSGDYVVVDNESHSVKIFSKDGQFIRVFGGSNLTSPWDVFVTNSGKIVVSDPPCGDVKVFSLKGKFLKSSEFGLHLQDPYGIAYHWKTKELAVCDKSTSCIYIHNPMGVVTDIVTTPLSSGESTDDGAKMEMPAYVTFDRHSNLYVSDAEAHRLFVFNKEGELQFTHGGEGQDEGELKHPAGICLDREGNIVLADSGNCRVAVLDKSGELISYVLTWEDGLAEPQALLVDDNRLVITEGSTGLVKVYDYIYPSKE